MKNIAVLIQSFTVEYSINILNGISSYFTDKENYRLIIGQTKNPNYKLGLYEYQYWAAEELLLSDEIDGIILISGSYSSTMKANCKRKSYCICWNRFRTRAFVLCSC